MTSTFATPAKPGEGIKWADLNGSLLLIDVGRLEAGIATSYGEADAVRGNVHVVDGPHAGTVHEDTLVFPKVLVGQLKTLADQKVLGRLTQGQAKPGQSAPWMLADPTEQDQVLAVNYLAKQTTSPAPPTSGDAEAPF